jgi:hypothetical protein
MIRVVSVGRNVAPWVVGTLDSVLAESKHEPVSLHVVLDPSEDDSQRIVEDWMVATAGLLPTTWTWNSERRCATPNQRTAIANADPQPGNIIVWLDLDGDRLLPGALTRIREEYDRGALLTFGSHVCVPPAPGNRPAVPYPPEVIASNSYRANITRHGAGFNHPRTMSAEILKAIPDDHYLFHRGPRKGQPYDYGADYVYMVPGLELAGPRHSYITDPILAYNHANPEADYLVSNKQTAAVLTDLLARTPLGPLEAPLDGTRLYLPDPDRYKILADHQERFGLRRMIETGTYRGDACAALAERFDRIDTIELDRRLHRTALQRFRGSNVAVHHGDSRKVLPQLLSGVTEPTLFWLDGHQSGPETAAGPCPLLAEIMLTLAHAWHQNLKHVILIDDARCLAGQPSHHEWKHYSDYPSMEWIEMQAKVAGYSTTLADDVLRLVPDQ